MNTDDFISVVVGFVLGFLVTLFLCSAYVKSQEKRWQIEAVQRGHAEFYIDKDFEKQWRWKE